MTVERRSAAEELEAEALRAENQRLRAEVAALRAERAGFEQDRAEARRGEERYRSLLEATRQLVWHADAEGRTVYAPNGIGGDRGAPMAEDGWGWLAYLHPDDRARVEATWRASVATGAIYEAEARVLDLEGEYRVLRARAVPIRDAAGRVVEWVGVNEDMTEQRAAEEALRHLSAERALAEQRALLESVLDNLPCVVLYMDGERRLRFANHAAQTSAGWDREALIGRRLGDVSPALDAQFDAQLQAVYERGEAWRAFGLVYEVAFAGGPSRTVCRDVTMVPVFAADGSVNGVLLLSFDVASRVRLEQEVAARSRELERQKNLIERILANAPVGLTYLDLDWTVRWMNPATQRMLSQPVEAYLGASLFAGRERYRQVMEPRLQEVVATGVPVDLENFPYEPPDGSPTRYCDARYVPIYANDGAIDGVLVITQDVTDRVAHARSQQARIDQLREVDRLKDEFLAAMRQELRSPIEAIIGYASIVDEGIAGPVSRDQHRFLTRIAQQADGLLSTVDELLEMSRLQAGEVELVHAPFRFPAVVSAVIGGLMPLARARGLRVVDEVPPDLAPLVADGPRLALVVRHLIGNAIKFSPEGATITVRARASETALRCEVRDEGPGIDPADLPRLFRPFTQLAADDAPRVGGVGLGLTIVRALVDAHGGRAGVDSTPGQGSTFWFEVPRR